MTEPEKIPAVGEIWSHFDLGEATKVITILAAFAYATGAIAINTYLHGLGIVDFSFAKPKLLLTGIVVLFTYLLLASPAFFIAWSIAIRHEETPRRLSSVSHIAILFVVSLMLLLSASVFSCFQTHPSMGQSTVWEVWRFIDPGSSIFKKVLASLIVTLVVYLPILASALSAYVAARLFDQERAERLAPHINLRRFYLVMAAAVFVVATIGYIFVFTSTFYSVIPQEFGGGKPYFQSFAVGQEDLCQLQQLGVPFVSGQPNVTQPLPVLHETDTLVAVWLNDTSKGSWDFVATVLDRKVITATKVVTRPDSPFPPRLFVQACKN